MTGAPILIVVGGLPATGKSTVASALVRRTGFAFVRVDRFGRAVQSGGHNVKFMPRRPRSMAELATVITVRSTGIMTLP
jgi:dephospho-CoA kinase